MKILSLFDGISCARVALEKVGIEVEEYFSSEIDQTAIEVSQYNYPENIPIGDVRNIKYSFGKLVLPYDDVFETNIDLIIGGSPCQDLSIAGKRAGIEGRRSELFWEFARLVKEVNPKYFILENVASMTKENIDIISKEMKVKPIMIDAQWFSAQRRKRLFWTNISVTHPTQMSNKTMKDIWIHDGNWEYEYIKRSSGLKSSQIGTLPNVKNNAQAGRVYSLNGKGVTLTALAGGLGGKAGIYAIDDSHARRPYPIECERLQGLPDDYTKFNEDKQIISDEKRKKMIGNGFNVDVIAYILKNLIN